MSIVFKNVKVTGAVAEVDQSEYESNLPKGLTAKHVSQVHAYDAKVAAALLHTVSTEGKVFFAENKDATMFTAHLDTGKGVVHSAQIDKTIDGDDTIYDVTSGRKCDLSHEDLIADAMAKCQDILNAD